MSSNSPIIALLLVSVLSFQLVSSQFAGTAEFYEAPYTPSACNGNNDDGVMVAQVSEAIFDRKVCGQMYNVTCLGATSNADIYPCTEDRATVTVKIVDSCTGCNADKIVLSLDAFKLIANPDAGEISVSYTIVPSS